MRRTNIPFVPGAMIFFKMINSGPRRRTTLARLPPSELRGNSGRVYTGAWTTRYAPECASPPSDGILWAAVVFCGAGGNFWVAGVSHE